MRRDDDSTFYRKPSKAQKRRAKKQRRKGYQCPSQPSRFPQPDKSDATVKPLLVRTLLVHTDTLVLRSTWERRKGNWRCISADPEIDWFLRVNHPEVVEQWLIRRHYRKEWIKSSSQQPAIQLSGQLDGKAPAASYPEITPSAASSQ